MKLLHILCVLPTLIVLVRTQPQPQRPLSTQSQPQQKKSEVLFQIADDAASNFTLSPLNRLYEYAQHIEQMLTVVQYQIALQQHKDSQNLDLSSYFKPQPIAILPKFQQRAHLFYDYEYFRRRRRRRSLPEVNNVPEEETVESTADSETDPVTELISESAPNATDYMEYGDNEGHGNATTQYMDLIELQFSMDEADNVTAISLEKIEDATGRVNGSTSMGNETLSMDDEDLSQNPSPKFRTAFVSEERPEMEESHNDRFYSVTRKMPVEVVEEPRADDSDLESNNSMEDIADVVLNEGLRDNAAEKLIIDEDTEETTKTTTAKTSPLTTADPSSYVNSSTTISTNIDQSNTTTTTTTPESTTTIIVTSTVEGSSTPPTVSSTTMTDSRLSETTSSSTSTTTTSSTTTSAAATTTTTTTVTTTPTPTTTTTTVDPCVKLSQDQLINELKQHGTYNPDLMAWDVPGVIRFLEKSPNLYQAVMKDKQQEARMVERNLNALERILRELNVDCNVRSEDTMARLYNFTYNPLKNQVKRISTEASQDWPQLRFQRDTSASEESLDDDIKDRIRTEYLSQIARDDVNPVDPLTKADTVTKFVENLIGNVHVVPFGCSDRGSSEDGYLRLCSSCQAIRRLPEEFFPTFINEVICDEDKACLYFHDNAHGKCKQKYMSFDVLRNVGTKECQIWRKYSLNVRTSCECFVYELSFFARYVGK